jgi:hypothetical protein
VCVYHCAYKYVAQSHCMLPHLLTPIRSPAQVMHQASVAFIAVSATNLILTFSEVRTFRG